MAQRPLPPTAPRAPRAPYASSPATSANTRAPAAASPAEPPRVGQALASLRERQGLTLDELSRRAGVSKSMLSQIERAQANPTVAVVWRLANALGVPMDHLLGNETTGPSPPRPAITWVPRHETPSLQGPHPGCLLRILGPIDTAGQTEWYELQLAPGAELDSRAHAPGTREHLSLLDGQLRLQAGESSQLLAAGETSRYAADQPHCIHNPGPLPVRALLVVMHGG